MKDWQLGYLAGMIDAECHIGIQRMFEKHRKTACYAIRFELAMTDRKPVEFVNSLLPNAKIIHQGARGQRLPYYRLRVIRQEALSLFRIVLPYIQGKQRQIEICLEIEELRKKYSPSRRHFGSRFATQMPPEYEKQVYPLWQEFRKLQLNKKPKIK